LKLLQDAYLIDLPMIDRRASRCRISPATPKLGFDNGNLVGSTSSGDIA
jgi:hypothetical protein